MKLIKVLLLVAIALVACEDDDETYELNPDNIAGTIRNDVTLLSGETYYLDGALIVENGGRLNIEAGVNVIAEGGTASYIAIAQGGQIFAQGTASAPIVLTSDRKLAGAWGGLIVCGRAPTNLMENTSTPIQAEVTDLLYGGDDSDDYSGELSYVRVEYSGYNYSDDKQFNGFSFFGVGGSTVINHISSYESMDDGIEFYGGSVEANFLVSMNSQDDGIDFTEGWQGSGSFWYSYNSTKSGIEGANNDVDGNASPVTYAELSNLTIYKMGERPWYLNNGAGIQNVDNIVIGGLEDNSGQAYFYFDDDDLNTINNINSNYINIDNVRFVNRGLNNDTDASGNLMISTNDSSTGAGEWSDPETLAPSWVSGWSMP